MPEPESSRWTPDLLYEHLTRLMDERHAQYAERFDSSQNAISKANEATQIRFETVNEWRTLVQGMIDELMKREEALTRLQQLSNRIDELQLRNGEQLATMQGRFTERIEAINQQLSTNEGARAGLSTGWQILLASIGAIGVLSMIYNLAK